MEEKPQEICNKKEEKGTQIYENFLFLFKKLDGVGPSDNRLSTY